MRDIAISVEGLSKEYKIGAQRERYRTLRDTLTDNLAAPFRAVRSVFKRSAAESQDNSRFLALQDINFEAERGEVIGVIGRNGAGKSTLLKILSRITEPTEGEARIYGRVGSLLEVGTGFHQELTGRENIHLNGAILGMKRSEINRKFEEIVEFAEVSKFIDTPVKHYSSGMYLRLAFAVAAHLETEILFVDEVLAVGDLAFQNKCLGKMQDVASEGRTILFVSHNLAAVKELCRSSIVLREGRLDFRGPVIEGLARYVQSFSQDEHETFVSGTGWRSIAVNAQAGGIANTIMGDEPIVADAILDLSEDFTKGRFICIIDDSVGATVLHQRVNNLDIRSEELRPDRYQLRIEFPPLWLAPGMYTMYFKFIGHKPSGQQERHYSERIILNVVGDIQKLGRATPVLSPPARWTLTQKELEVEVLSDF